MSGGDSPGNKPEGGGDAGSGSGASGEGANSALQAMLKKRQMRVNPPAPPAAPTAQQQERPLLPLRRRPSSKTGRLRNNPAILAKHSAGLLMYRRTLTGAVEVLLAHPGGPYWTRRDAAAWTLPKGECEEGEDLLDCARREFEEETGCAPSGPFSALGEVRQKSGKLVAAWTFEGDMDPAQLESLVFEMEWPPRSGQLRFFPEVDRVGWFDLDAARAKLLPAQAAFIDRLEQVLDLQATPPPASRPRSS